MNPMPAEESNPATASRSRRVRVKKALAFILIPPLLAAFFLVQDYFSYSYLTGTPFALRATAVYKLMVVYTWAAMLPLIFRLIRAVRARRRDRWAGLAMLLIACVPFALVHRAATIFILVPISMPHAFTDGIPAWLYRKVLAGSFSSLVECWVILGGYLGFEYYRHYREQTIVRARLETQLAQAHLRSLTMQLQPHFLFNTLHTISSLMNEDVPSARRMLVRLSDLLRQTLENISTQEVTLKQELEFLRGYVEIEQTRFMDRLQVKEEIDREILDAIVPKLILQPLAENAIRHGILPRPEGGRLTIRARREGVLLRLEVADDGVGMNAGGGETIKEGLGLSNVRQRLRHLYGPSHDLEIQPIPGGGLVASMTIPFRVQSNFHA